MFDQLAPRARRVHELAATEGFGLCGIAPAAASEHAGWVRQWLAEQKHGQMAYLAERVEQRLDPARLVPGAKAVIVVADAYDAPSSRGQTADDQTGPSPEHAPAHPSQANTGRITRYARGKDYHKTVKKRLHRMADALRERFTEASFKCTCDTAPILEREHASRAGLGWIGKHTLLIHPRHGSFFFIGCIVTDHAVQTSAEANYPGQLVPPTDHCGTCTRCIDACPTQCIDDPDETGHRAIDASRCISYLTIEHRDTIDPALHPAMGDWLAGCDICQEVCPYNSASQNADGEAVDAPLPLSTANANNDDSRSQSYIASVTGLPVHPRHRPAWPDRWPLVEVLNWTESDYQARLQGSALKRIKLGMWKRNALIVAGNVLREQSDAAIENRIHELADDENEPAIVRHTAQQIQKRLGDTKETS